MKTLLLLLLAWQDPALDDRVIQLLEQLKSDAPAEREAASRELTRIGPAAVPRLKEAMKGDDIELRDRIKQTLKAIDIGLKVRDIDRPLRMITAELPDAPLAGIVKAIEEQSGTKVDASAVPEGHRFTFRVKQLPILQALDTLCAESDLLTYDWPAGGGVKLAIGKWTPYPAAYSGAYRIRIKSLLVIRGQNFEDHQARLQLLLEPDHDRSLKPLREGQLKVDEIVDDQGAKLEPGDPGKQKWQVFNLGRPLVQEGRGFEFANLSPKATKLASIKVTATYAFPTETQEVLIEAPARGATQEIGRYKVVVTNATTDSLANSTLITLSFSPVVGSVADMKQDIESRFETASVILVDDAGREHPAVLTAPQHVPFVEPKNPGVVEFVFTVGMKLQRSERKSLKLQFHKETYQKAVTVEFKDVRLP